VGSNAQRAGRALEDDLTRFHLRRADIYAHKNNPDIGRGKKGPPDFTACVNGRGVLFDAKSTREETWPVSLLKPHQATALERFRSAGGVAAIYLRLATGDRWVTWPEFRERWRDWYATGRPHRLSVADGVAVSNCDWPAVIDSVPR